MPVVPPGGGGSKLAGSYNGLAFGLLTDFHVAGMDGFWDLPDIQTSDVPKLGANGWFAGVDTLGRRTVVLTLHLIASTVAAYDILVGILMAAVDVQPTTELPLRFWNYDRYIYCRPRRRTIPIDCGYNQRTGTAVIEFVATNPTVYSGAP